MMPAPDNGKGKEGAGSVRIGATGKVSDLMTRELESIKSSSSKVPRSTSHKTRTQSAPVSISCGGVSTRRLRQTSLGSTPKKKNSAGRLTNSHLPMLGSDEISMDSTPNRGDHKPEKKKPLQIVEIVDLKCGSSNPDGPSSWSSPIANQLRRLSFSKLSD